MRYQTIDADRGTDREDALGVCHDEIRAVLRDAWLPLPSGIEWIIESMETRGRVSK